MRKITLFLIVCMYLGRSYFSYANEYGGPNWSPLGSFHIRYDIPLYIEQNSMDNYEEKKFSDYLNTFDYTLKGKFPTYDGITLGLGYKEEKNEMNLLSGANFSLDSTYLQLEYFIGAMAVSADRYYIKLGKVNTSVDSSDYSIENGFYYCLGKGFTGWGLSFDLSYEVYNFTYSSASDEISNQKGQLSKFNFSIGYEIPFGG